MEKKAVEYYEKTNFDFGEVRHNEMPIFELKCKDSNFEAVLPGCGCTAPHIKPNGDVYGYLNINSAIGRDKHTAERLLGEFKKDMKAYIKSEHPLWVKNSKGNNIINPKKDYVRLTLTGNVIV